MRTDRKYYSEYNALLFKQYVCDELGQFPACIVINELDIDQFYLAAFIESWDLLAKTQDYGQDHFDYAYYKIDNEIYVRFEHSSRKSAIAGFYCTPSSEGRVRDIIHDNKLHRKSTKTSIRLLVADGSDHTFDPFEINPVPLDISKHFNDDFQASHEKILELSRANASGLILLNGLPGTGKTSYLQYLAANSERKFLFVPPGMGDWLGSSDFNGLMKHHTDAVLIIEDAEKILSKRGSQRSNATSNLLNLTDGILSSCFNTLVIATFNCGIASVDEALLRPGRLKVQYEFGKLSADKSATLSEGRIISESNLAEIYCDQATHFVQSKPIGFAKN